MIKLDTLKEAAHFRVVESEEDYWVEDYWKATIKLFTADVNATIMFLQNDCDDEELYFLSEIFEEIVEQTHSKELVSALRSRLATVTLENYNQQCFRAEFMRKYITYEEYVKDIKKEIDFAEGRLDE